MEINWPSKRFKPGTKVKYLCNGDEAIVVSKDEYIRSTGDHKKYHREMEYIKYNDEGQYYEVARRIDLKPIIEEEVKKKFQFSYFHWLHVEFIGSMLVAMFYSGIAIYGFMGRLPSFYGGIGWFMVAFLCAFEIKKQYNRIKKARAKRPSS